MSVADQNENKIEPIPQPPSLVEKIMSGGKIVALVLALLAGAVEAFNLTSPGLLPPQVLAVAHAITAIAAGLGIGSSGLKKKADELK